MMYHYEPPEHWSVNKGQVYKCDHPLYSQCTLYSKDGVGLAVVQERFNGKTKMSWLGPIDPWLVDDIASQPGWIDFFADHAKAPENGLYPTTTIRKVMWALRMKPLEQTDYEKARSKHITFGR